MSERTTVRLPEDLLKQAKRKAAAEGRTLTSSSRVSGCHPAEGRRIHPAAESQDSVPTDSTPELPYDHSNAVVTVFIFRTARARWGCPTPTGSVVTGFRLSDRCTRGPASLGRNDTRRQLICAMDAQLDRAEAKPLTHRETLLIVFGVLLPTFMGSLDQTILASALPTIGRDMGEVYDLPWLITAYLLASTAVIPLYGKIADIHGRRFTLRIAILTYMAGSLICALAPNMLVLIFGCILHGLGGGGLSSMGMIVLADLVAPKERGRYYTYFALTYTTAGGSGPALGGFIADHLHWSIIFWINIPMGLAALAITTSLLSRLPRYERPHRLDIIGAVLIVLASVSFMLALNLGGARYPWTSLPILALFAVALVMGCFFVLRLLTAPGGVTRS